MSESQPGSKPLANRRHERWCLKVNAGYSDMAAYRIAFAGASQDNADSNAHRMRGFEGVEERLAWLARNDIPDSLSTKEERLAHLESIIFTPLSEISPDSSICQEYVVTESERGSRTTVKKPNVISAHELIARMVGDLAPQEQKLSFDLTPEQLENLSKATAGARAANAAMGIGSTESKP